MSLQQRQYRAGCCLSLADGAATFRTQGIHDSAILHLRNRITGSAGNRVRGKSDKRTSARVIWLRLSHICEDRETFYFFNYSVTNYQLQIPRCYTLPPVMILRILACVFLL